MNNIIGKPVEGDDFFGRANEVELVWEQLRSDNILLLAPRRVGKTSFMYRLRDQAQEHGFFPIYESVADLTSEFEFVQRMYRAVTQHRRADKVIGKLKKGALGHYFRRVKKLNLFVVSVEFADAVARDWTQLGDALTHALSDLDGQWLFLIDELPIFILSLLHQDQGGERARNFLNWFRQRRIDGRCRSLRWLLAGSIGLDTVTRRIGLGDTINDLRIYADFGPYTEHVAHQFLGRLAASYGFELTEPVKRRICECAGWLIPFHLHLYFNELRALCRGRDRAPTPDDVGAAHERLLSPSRRAYFDFWVQRLSKELGSTEGEHASMVLDAVARDPQGVLPQTLSATLMSVIKEPQQRKETLRYLIDVLGSDGYLVRQAGRYQFRSSLLRDYWRRRNQL